MFLNVPGPISLTAQSLWGIAPWTDQQISWINNQFLIFRRWYYSTLALFLSGFVCWGWKKCEKALNNNNFKKKICPSFHTVLSGSYSHLHSFFMRLEALLLMVFGKSTWSMPRIVAVRIFRGSEWLNGSLERRTGGRQDNFNLQS